MKKLLATLLTATALFTGVANAGTNFPNMTKEQKLMTLAAIEAYDKGCKSISKNVPVMGVFTLLTMEPDLSPKDLNDKAPVKKAQAIYDANPASFCVAIGKSLDDMTAKISAAMK